MIIIYMVWPPLGLHQFRLALVQLAVGADKAANLQRASRMVREAAENGAQVVALPVSGGPGTAEPRIL